MGTPTPTAAGCVGVNWGCVGVNWGCVGVNWDEARRPAPIKRKASSRNAMIHIALRIFQDRPLILQNMLSGQRKRCRISPCIVFTSTMQYQTCAPNAGVWHAAAMPRHMQVCGICRRASPRQCLYRSWDSLAGPVLALQTQCFARRVLLRQLLLL